MSEAIPHQVGSTTPAASPGLAGAYMKWLAQWVPGGNYQTGDAIQYLGEVYIATAPVTSKTPPPEDPTNWIATGAGSVTKKEVKEITEEIIAEGQSTLALVEIPGLFRNSALPYTWLSAGSNVHETSTLARHYKPTNQWVKEEGKETWAERDPFGIDLYLIAAQPGSKARLIFPKPAAGESGVEVAWYNSAGALILFVENSSGEAAIEAPPDGRIWMVIGTNSYSKKPKELEGKGCLFFTEYETPVLPFVPTVYANHTAAKSVSIGEARVEVITLKVPAGVAGKYSSLAEWRAPGFMTWAGTSEGGVVVRLLNSGGELEGQALKAGEGAAGNGALMCVVQSIVAGPLPEEEWKVEIETFGTESHLELGEGLLTITPCN